MVGWMESTGTEKILYAGPTFQTGNVPKFLEATGAVVLPMRARLAFQNCLPHTECGVFAKFSYVCILQYAEFEGVIQ